MRRRSMEKMERINAYMDTFFFDHGRMPSTTEIVQEFGMGRGTAYQYLVTMDKEGLISYVDGKVMTKKREKVSGQTSPSEVFIESIPCGPAETIEAQVEDYVQLPVSIFGNAKYFLLRTTGDSMIEAGITEGDTVVVQKQETAEVGDIVVALTDEGNTLKRLKYDQKLNRYYLHPDNPELEDIYPDVLRIQGIAKFIIKSI